MRDACFLRNGLDAVLVGPSGSLEEWPLPGGERGYWYKIDRYYPPEIPVLPVPHRRELIRGYRPSPGGPWYELAPLAYCTYRTDPPPLPSAQSFDPEDGVLHTRVQVGGALVQVVTFLHYALPLLVEHYEATEPIVIDFVIAPGVWAETSMEREPFLRPPVFADDGFRFRVGDRTISGWMVVDGPVEARGREGKCVGNCVRARSVTRFAAIVDSQEKATPKQVADAIRQGWRALLAHHRAFWREHTARGATVHLPDRILDRVFAYTRYQLKASQSRESGGLPVNALRSTWSSHLLWDMAFIHRALLLMGYLEEGERACAFLERTAEAARAAAAAEGAAGLKWEWEITHDGRPAYGVHRHLAGQIHNNAAYSTMLWSQCAAARDRALLRRFAPLLAGIAEYYLTGVLTAGRLRPVVGVGEMNVLLRREPATLAGAVRALRLGALAGRVLGRADLGARCLQAARALLTQLPDALRGGDPGLASVGVPAHQREARVVRDGPELNFGILVPIFPMEVIPAHSPQALDLVARFLAGAASPHGMPGSGIAARRPREAFPWAAGLTAAILARGGRADEAWRLLQGVGPAVNAFGGMAEHVDDIGGWNMQYFGTAQAVVCIAIAALLVLRRGAHWRLLPVPPPAWDGCGVRNLTDGGVAVSFVWARRGGFSEVRMRNLLPLRRRVRVTAGGETHRVTLAPFQEVAV